MPWPDSGGYQSRDSLHHIAWEGSLITSRYHGYECSTANENKPRSKDALVREWVLDRARKDLCAKSGLKTCHLTITCTYTFQLLPCPRVASNSKRTIFPLVLVLVSSSYMSFDWNVATPRNCDLPKSKSHSKLPPHIELPSSSKLFCDWPGNTHNVCAHISKQASDLRHIL